MDEDSILFSIRNAFALGNYQTVINEVSSTRALSSPAAKLEAQTYLYRSYVAQGKYNLVINDIDDASAEAPLKAVRLLAVYLRAKQKKETDVCRTAIEQLLALLEQGANRVDPLVQVIVATALVNDGNYEEALKVLHSRTKKLECTALAVQIYLQMDRLDLARKEVAHTKSWAEDALLLQLMEAWVDLRVGGEKYQEAFYIYEEFGQSGGSEPSLKVLNGQAAANIALGRYPEAESLLLEALNKNNDDPDTLVNMIVCANLTSKSADVINRYISQLREVAPDHPFLEELDLKSSLFDKAAARFALVDAS